MFLQESDKTSKNTGVQGASDAANEAYLQGLEVGTAYSKGVTDNLLSGEFTEAGKWFTNQLNEVLNPAKIYEKTRALDSEATKIRNSLGLGVEKAREFQLLIADNAASFAELGFSVAEVGKTFTDLVGVYGTNLAISDEDLLQVKATAQVTGQEVGTLASSFRGVGISINEVGENMTMVTEIARNAGVSVGAVSKEVVSNLDKMNIYNFEGGVKGLAKMSAQATRLGVDMSKIFGVVEEAFNPEGAIKLAGAMQRLGVQTSALLDPLRLMDLSQNDPTELQNQIINMSKDFVRFNKELGQFEIMPGEKRRLNEIGKELGMTSGELQKMALNAANLDMKMKQIKFPSSIASKEDRELIATLSTVNKQGVAEIKVRKYDAEGKDTGEYDLVAASELNAEQLEAIKRDQELRGKTMEEIAFDQLNETQKLNSKFDQFFKAITYGQASSNVYQGLYSYSTKEIREQLFTERGKEGGLIGEPYNKTETYRRGTNYATNELKTVIDDILKSMNIDGIKGLKDKGFEFITDGIGSIVDKIGGINMDDITGVSDILTKIKDMASGFGIGGSETDPYSDFTKTKITETNNTNINKFSSINKSESIEIKPIDINEKIDVNITVTLDPAIKDQALTELATKAINEYFKGGQNTKNTKTVTDAIEMAMSMQKMIVSSITPKTYVDKSE
jgi:hypothetical protein